MAKGCSQREGVDFGEIFSPIAKLSSIIILLSIVTTYDFKIEQMDVKNNFLNGDLEDKNYM